MHMILKSKFRLIIAVFSALLFFSNANAQKELTAKDAVFLALENNYQISIAKKQEEIAVKNNKWSEAGLFPTVTLAVGQNNSIQDNTDNPFTFTPGIILSQSIAPSLNLNWNLFSGFRVKISKLRLEQLEEQSSNNVIAVVEATIQDVLKAYYTAQLQNDRKELFQNVLTSSRERFEYYELKEKYSAANSLDLLQFKNQYLTDSTNFLMQDISHQNALRNLGIVMNDTVFIEQGYILTDEIGAVITDVDFNAANKEMMANNQNLKNQYINLELQRSNTSLRRSFLYPVLSLNVGANPSWSKIREIKDDLFEQDANNLTYYGNLNLQYTLFNNWKNKRAVEVSQIQEEIAELNIESMKQTLSSTLKNLIDLYQLRKQLVAISQENLVYAEKAYNLAKNRYDIGAINSIDLATFQNNYQNTMIQHFENQFNKMDTYLEIYKMTGKLSLNY
ncbi:MAG TPA: TolC family protein [Crocinitomicaceae bacterium]|nr:TolC family protein [Crocinitomicaceae bacterium]